MTFTYYPSEESATAAIATDEPLLMVVAFDGRQAIIAPLDEAVEHHVLLAKCGLSTLDIDKYFRVVVDKQGADWTFVCPSTYKNIIDKRRRIESF